MRPTACKRIEQVQDPVIPIIGAWIRDNPGTLSLAQGVVSYSPPDVVAETLGSIDPSDPAICRYGPAAGQDALLEIITDKLLKENDIDCVGRQVFCTAGSNMAFLTVLLAIANVGDEVLLVRPYYFNHQMAIELAGCHCKYADSTPDFQLDIDAIANGLTDRVRAVVTVSPNNPSGAVYPREALSEVNRLCGERGIYHIHDEAYEYFTFDDREHFSPASLPESLEHTVSLFSISKSFAMAGWRFGYAVVPEHLTAAVQKVQDTNLISVSGVTQQIASAVIPLGQAWCKQRIAALSTARDMVLAARDHLSGGATICQPQGAFYALLTLPARRHDLDVVQQLIERFKVAVLPGSTFGINSGCVLRVSFGGLPLERLEAALARLTAGIREL
ncbi:MAG TPA: pyridoxal phosphate-dependent aminotransferase [Planctomycetaceae bacterium]|nr:pyridoxal phosphate-dependent aminotransferase [Planctomycetaceae bacterium]